MMSLHECFIPDFRTGQALIRIRHGLDVTFDSARPLISAGLAYVVTVPTAASGYDLTDNGTEALLRFYEFAIQDADEQLRRRMGLM